MDAAKTALRSLPTGDLRLTPCSFPHTCNLPSVPRLQPASTVIVTAQSAAASRTRAKGSRRRTPLTEQDAGGGLHRWSGDRAQSSLRFLALLGPSVFLDLAETRLAQIIIVESREPRAGIRMR